MSNNELKIKSEYGEPPHRICDICLDDGGCLNNEKHKDYEKNNEDFFGTDYLDCVNYLENKNNTQGQFIKGYIKNLQEEEKKNNTEGQFMKGYITKLQKEKSKDEAEGGFKKWSKSI